MKKIILLSIMLLSIHLCKASDTTMIPMNGTYNKFGKERQVYLDKSNSKLFYFLRNKRVYFRKVKTK